MRENVVDVVSRNYRAFGSAEAGSEALSDRAAASRRTLSTGARRGVP